MPYRTTVIAAGETYHVFNRSVAKQPIFLTQRDYQRILDVLLFYSFGKPSLRFSHYNRLTLLQKENYLADLKAKSQKQVQILAFCIMPNHFHLLLKEISKNGISTFLRNLQNSYARYFNIKSKRVGAVFQAMFKAVRIESDEQFLHVSRYIHLNPITSFIVKGIKELENYKWSSLPYYLNQSDQDLVNTRDVLEDFSSVKAFKEFIFDQIDYQQQLGKIKHLLLEDPEVST